MKIKLFIIFALMTILAACGVTPPTLPSPSPSIPANTVATAQNTSQINLSWASVTGVSNYEIYRHTSSNSAGSTKIFNPVGTSYENTGLSANTTYYYWIKACNSDGCSAYSSVVSAQTQSNAPLPATNTATTIPRNGLVAEYLFNGNANDTSGNGNHGTVIGATLANDRNGVANSAYSIAKDSSFDRIELPNEVVNGLNDFTISTWVNAVSNTVSNAVLSASNATSYNEFLFEYAYLGTDGWLAVIDNNSYRFNNSDSPVSEWLNLVLVRSGNKLSLYINNALFGTKTTNNSTIDANKVVLGQDQDQDGFEMDQSLNGKIDDVRIYNRALSASEIQAIYNDNNVVAPRNGLVAEYLFNGNANDTSGNGNHGTVIGATLANDRNGVANSAYSFNGNSYITLNNTITSYFKLDSFSLSFFYSRAGNNSNSNGHDWQRLLNSDGIIDVFHLNTRGGVNTVSENYLHVVIGDLATDNGSNGRNDIIAVGGYRQLNSLYNMTLTKDGNLINVYINGSLAVSRTLTSISYGNGFKTEIGTSDPAKINNAVGKIDDVRIYNRALSASEIQAIYNDNNVVYNANTGHWYQFVSCEKPWTEAKTFAQQHGGYLVTINSAAENQFLVDNNMSGWIGLTDEAQEGSWRWITGEPTNYTSWNANYHEPNGGIVENYAHLFGLENLGDKQHIIPAGTWNDLKNNTSSHGIYFRPKIIIEYETKPTNPASGCGN